MALQSQVSERATWGRDTQSKAGPAVEPARTGALSWLAPTHSVSNSKVPAQRRANPTRSTHDAPHDAAALGSLRHAARFGARRGQRPEPGSGAPATPDAAARAPAHAPARAAAHAPARRAGAHPKTRARAHAAADAGAVLVRAHNISALDAPDAPPDLRAHDAGADARDALPDDETDAVLRRGC